MAHNLKLFLNFMILFLFSFSYASVLPEWHMKPIGSHVKPETVDESFADDIITPEDFAKKYVLPRKPIIFRNVVKTWPAFNLWTDEYLREHYGDMEMRLEGKREKEVGIPKGDVCLGRDRLRTFLDVYKEGADKYIVSELPTPMWHDVHVPPPMSCGEFLTRYVEIDLWINSDLGKKGKGGNSILHKDAFNTVNCVLNGTKEWKLIELQYNDYVYQSWEGPMDAGYGGFSLVNPDKVDAAEFPNFGKIPRWQFASIKAGDCLYLPSQMWHQVKSYGETNRAVAFLFSKFENVKVINTTSCVDTSQHVPLSDVDVDLQYPGNGIMTMGHSELEDARGDLMDLIDDRKGVVTKKRVHENVYDGHSSGAIKKKLILQKGKTLYEHLLAIAGGKKERMTDDLIKNLTRDQIRFTYNLLQPIEPANSYNHEYAYLLPEDLEDLIDTIKTKNNGKVEKEAFMKSYQDFGGTQSFAESFWERLAGDKLTVHNISETIQEALRPYEENRRDRPDTKEVGDDATITTPQGHVSQPKRRKGGYSRKEDDGDENDVENDNDGGKDVNEVGDDEIDIDNDNDGGKDGNEVGDDEIDVDNDNDDGKDGNEVDDDEIDVENDNDGGKDGNEVGDDEIDVDNDNDGGKDGNKDGKQRDSTTAANSKDEL